MAASEPAEAATGGESPDELNPEERATLTEAFDAALSQRHADPRWHREAVLDAMREALAQGFPATAIAAGIRRMALDPRSRYPGRLPHLLSLDEKTRPSGDDGQVEEPKRVLGRGDPRCRRHPWDLATNCAGCAGEAAAGDDGEDLLAAGRLPADQARALARQKNAEAQERRRAEEAAYRRRASRPAMPAPREVPAVKESCADEPADDVLTSVR